MNVKPLWKDETYLGDGVYASVFEQTIRLFVYSEDELGTVYLEYETWVALKAYAEKAFGE